ncbi:MAG: ribosome recycling factor [Proteobacteria bacterium]|nr:ribosome recycling factor [Pseudomonadota bacterium]
MSDIVKNCKESMDKRSKSLDGELKQVRTGRASVAVLDNVRVDYYGNPTPLSQVATMSTPDARTITIAPFEKKLIAEIEKAIHKADIGVQPTNDGNVVRLPFPALTEDRRKDIVKNIKKIGEEAKISIRNIRRDSNEEIKKQEKEKKVSEDDRKKLEIDVQKHTDNFIKMIDDKILVKEKEVMTI